MSTELDHLRTWMEHKGYDGLALSVAIGYRSDWFKTIFAGNRGVRRTVRARFIAIFGQEEYYRAFGVDAPVAIPNWVARQQMAHLVVSTAVQSGKLPQVSAMKCHGCPKNAQQYHHNEHYHPSDYLCVCPLCRKCHRQHHTGKKRLTFGVFPTSVGLVRIAIATQQ